MDISDMAQAQIMDDGIKEIGIQLANRFVNILDVTPVMSEGTTTNYVILFEYKFKSPRRDGWHKYAVETSPYLPKALVEVYDIASKLQEALSE